MSETTWKVIDTKVGDFNVAEPAGRGLIAFGLTREEADEVANCREAVDALGVLWDAIHCEDGEGFDSDRVREELGQAFDVLLRAKGLKT